MENCCIFVVTRQKSNITLPGADFFISALGKHHNHGLPIPDGFCTVRLEIDFGELGDRYALFSYTYNNFSFMPKSVKNCGHAQGASIATCNPTTTGIQSFLFNPETHVRVLNEHGEPWFVAVNVCRALNYTNVTAPATPVEKVCNIIRDIRTAQLNLDKFYESDEGALLQDMPEAYLKVTDNLHVAVVGMSEYIGLHFINTLPI